VTKVDTDGGTLTIQPTGPDGKPSKSPPLVLKIAGTSNFFLVRRQEPKGKAPFFQQEEIKANKVRPRQAISVTYARLGKDDVVLAAVLVPLAD
jgi:hypothetical protein